MSTKLHFEKRALLKMIKQDTSNKMKNYIIDRISYKSWVLGDDVDLYLSKDLLFHAK